MRTATVTPDPNIMIPAIREGVQTDGGAFNVREGNHSENLPTAYQLRSRLEPSLTLTFKFSYLEATRRDVGYSAGRYERRLSGGPAGSFDDIDKFVVILKRTAGAWKAEYVIYNSD